MPYADRAKQREAQAAYQRRKVQKTREYVQAQKAAPCTDCGAQYPWYVMQFDHVRGVKTANIRTLQQQGHLAGVKRELEKCELVCANCHAARTYKRTLAG